ncbi:hypothetical protein RZR26_25455, partial [Citrobacter freundii]|nr:hypothetical protein [Citrobacter freundii]MEB0388946.1 hypothetical protein [Citrobacter freundii]
MRQNLPVTGRNLELPKDANILSTTSPQSHITYVNPDFIKISGFTEEERHCCKVSDEAAFCLIQRPYISKTLLT